MNAARGALDFGTPGDPMPRTFRLFLTTLAPVLLLDQLSKGWIRGHLAVHGHIDLIEGVFRIWHRTNTGGAWSILGDATWGMPLLIVVSTVAVVGMSWFAWSLGPRDRLAAFALGLMGGGGLGNLLDRVRFQQVTDFLDVYQADGPVGRLFELIAGGPHFPTFNVADMGIVTGGILLAVLSFVRPFGAPNTASDEAATRARRRGPHGAQTAPPRPSSAARATPRPPCAPSRPSLPPTPPPPR